jgi:TRAP-type C4-dicarboxylate transport system permease small subunit
MTRVPWFTLVAAAVLILNPLGWEIVGSAIRYSPTDWLRDLWVLVALIGVAVLVVMGGLEAWYRGRRLRAKAAERNLGTET